MRVQQEKLIKSEILHKSKDRRKWVREWEWFSAQIYCPSWNTSSLDRMAVWPFIVGVKGNKIICSQTTTVGDMEYLKSEDQSEIFSLIVIMRSIWKKHSRVLIMCVHANLFSKLNKMFRTAQKYMAFEAFYLFRNEYYSEFNSSKFKKNGRL